MFYEGYESNSETVLPQTEHKPIDEIVYLNGNLISLRDASISVLDRGFIFGDGIYEVIPVYDKKAFKLNSHLERLSRNLESALIKNPYQIEEWVSIINDVIEENFPRNQSIYIQVTRGVSPRMHMIPNGIVPTVFVMATEFEKNPSILNQEGVSAITIDDTRWNRCDIKSISMLPSVLLREEAVAKDAREAILIRDNYVTEGATSNVFIVQDGCLITPPESNLLLSGVTRDVVLEIAESNGFNFKEDLITKADLMKAQEVWITGSIKEIMPVTRINNQVVGSGKPGRYWKLAYELYKSLINDDLKLTA